MSRQQSRAEEKANTLSHFSGIVIGIGCLIFFMRHDFGTGALIFASSLILLYSISTVYHFLPEGRRKHQFRILDHSAIFILIAGTYTPFLLKTFEGTWELVIMISVWLFALSGVMFKIFGGVDKRRISIILYVLMGWIFLMVAKPLWEVLSRDSIFWLLGGGVFYTGGIFFYTWEKLRFNHLVWHLFVLSGSLCHVVGVFNLQ